MTAKQMLASTMLMISVAFLLTGCQTSSPEKTQIRQGAIIFIDKSVSSDTLTPNQFRVSRDIIVQTIHGSGDFVCFGALYSQTGNTTLDNDEELQLGNPQGNSRGQMRMFEFESDNRRNQFISTVIRRISKHSRERNGETTASQTDILGSFKLVEDKFRNLKEGGKTLIYLSDMIQSSPMRDFDKQKQNSLDQVRKYGIEDAQKVKEIYKLDNNLLKGTRIAVVFPDKGLASNRNSEMKAYWESVFSALGAEQNNMSFQ